MIRRRFISLASQSISDRSECFLLKNSDYATFNLHNNALLNLPSTQGIEQPTKLSTEQNMLLNLLQSGENVYFTGKAGSGKTEVLKIFIHRLRIDKIKVGITAPTGVAASLLEGQTLHSFSSLPINLYRFDVTSFCAYVKSKKTILKRYLETDCIIIDEISMVSGEFFDSFNQVCKTLRGNDKPFGGIQIVMTGDFFQLPPVLKEDIQTGSTKNKNLTSSKKKSSLVTNRPHYSAFLEHFHGKHYNAQLHLGISGQVKEECGSKFIFHSKCWLELMMNNLKIRELTQSFRQMDSLFISILDDLRFGVHSPELWEFLKTFKNKHLEWPMALVDPTFLSPYRITTDRYNSKKLFEIPNQVYSFESIDSVKLNEPINSWKEAPSPFALEPIFSSFAANNVLNLKIGAQVILVRNIDVKNNLANGSRGVVIAFQNQYDNLTDRVQMLPVIRFSTGETYIVGYHDFQTRLDVDGITVQRRQIPLQLGWGMTIHRAQGMTLDKAIIDMPVSFAPGHAYVAFSRVKSLQGLSIERFQPESLCASEKVEKFYTFFLTGRHQNQKQ